MFDRGDSIAFSAWILYVRADDLEGSIQAVRDGGGQGVHGPMEAPGGDRLAQRVDPRGAVLALHASPQPAEDSPAGPDGATWGRSPGSSS